MKRKFLFALYQTPRGKLLQAMEGQFLKRAITVGCKQWQLQIGGLGWEDAFVDCSLYQNYCIVDADAASNGSALRIRGKAYSLPMQSESMDLIIVPHLLEFDQQRFRTIREIERVLKPGGELIVLNFNPMSFMVRYQLLLDRRLADSWFNHLISRRRLMDWLKLMNFEVLSTVEFNLDTFTIRPGAFRANARSMLAMAYGVKAVKRRYKLIPVGETGRRRPGFASAVNGMKYITDETDKHD